MQEYPYYINGEFKKSEKEHIVINPTDGQGFAKIFDTTKEDIELAIKSAQNAQKQWRQTSFKERALVLRDIAKVLYDNLKVLAELETKEIGKPLKETLFVDITQGAECFNYYASFLENLQEDSIPSNNGIDLIEYDPYGVCGVFIPYNVPLMIFGYSCAQALAAGNSLIIKPSEYGALSLLALANYLGNIDIPKGLINIISGCGQTVGSALASADIDLLAFTGSYNTLKKVIAASANNPKKIICELGGCNLAVVFSDADLDDALENIIAASFMKTGQMCIGTSAILVEEPLYKKFVDKLVDKAKKIKLGDPFSADIGMGPLPTIKHREDLHNRVESLRANGSKVLCGGIIPQGSGYFYPPTIIEVKDFGYEEFFGPVVVVKSFKEGSQVEEIIDNNPTGLVLQLWTKNIGVANILSQRAKAGTVWINTFVQMNSQIPFGGMAKSGWGRSLGQAGFFEYVQLKHIGIGFKKSPVCGWFGV